MKIKRAKKTKATMIKCPRCDGGSNPLLNMPAFPNKKMLEIGQVELLKIFACGLCNGEKYISEEKLSWFEDGNILKSRRKLSKCDLRSAAKSAGISLSELLDMENGHIKPNMDILYY